MVTTEEASKGRGPTEFQLGSSSDNDMTSKSEREGLLSLDVVSELVQFGEHKRRGYDLTEDVYTHMHAHSQIHG